MSEVLRSICVTVEIDTNERSFVSVYHSVYAAMEALREWEIPEYFGELERMNAAPESPD